MVFGRAFSGAFVGKLVAALFIAICAVLGFGPDKWAAWLVNGLGSWATPLVARIALLCLGGIASILLIATIVRGRTEPRPSGDLALLREQRLQHKQNLEEQRLATKTSTVQPPVWISVKTALHYMSGQKSAFEGKPEEAKDALRQAASDGLVIRGRPESAHLAIGQGYKPLVDIPREHWRDFDIDLLRCYFHEDERACRSEPDESHSRRHHETFVELQVDEAEIERRWPLNLAV